MVAKEFIDFFNTIVYADHVAIEDFADRMNLFTVILFLISCLIITAKQYLLNAISCYIPVKPGGDNFKEYLTDYCWVHGTIPLRPDERLPKSHDEWMEYDAKRRISEYFCTVCTMTLSYYCTTLFVVLASLSYWGDIV